MKAFVTGLLALLCCAEENPSQIRLLPAVTPHDCLGSWVLDTSTINDFPHVPYEVTLDIARLQEHRLLVNVTAVNSYMWEVVAQDCAAVHRTLLRDTPKVHVWDRDEQAEIKLLQAIDALTSLDAYKIMVQGTDEYGLNRVIVERRLRINTDIQDDSIIAVPDKYKRGISDRYFF
eukprot:Blabericola_migrator_1__13406@NODE_958_length_5894_cov_24_472113_g664_i0_p4_GENE_NODE_958_length_5894_cov_24_472113_g664_i0NODE_958_length_5894_cov_24_472113_g664_i0_p4_ORF_typecomplete_len175_score32_34_NODE_958_length_5894_cov_24_472113_g664_i07861310